MGIQASDFKPLAMNMDACIDAYVHECVQPLKANGGRFVEQLVPSSVTIIEGSMEDKVPECVRRLGGEQDRVLETCLRMPSIQPTKGQLSTEGPNRNRLPFEAWAQ